MCNAYRIGRTSKRQTGAAARVAEMRWGFHRPYNPAVNNARSDKLDGGMWKHAYRFRRCVIPVSAFYE